MLRLLGVCLLALVIGVFCLSPLAFADGDGGSFGAALALAATDLTFPDGVDRTFIPSSGVRVAYGNSVAAGGVPAGVYYWVAAQHINGTYQFAQHHENARPYYRISTKGVWNPGVIATPTITPSDSFPSTAWLTE